MAVSAAATTLLSLLLLHIAPTEGTRWDGALPTGRVLSDIALEQGFSPKPTPPPSLWPEQVDISLPQNVLQRQLGLHTCGFISAVSASYLTCPQGYVCATGSVNNVEACCDPGRLSICYLPTSCIAFTSLGDCDNECQGNPFIVKCYTSTVGECYTYGFDYDTATPTLVGCASSSFSASVALSYTSGSPAFSGTIVPAATVDDVTAYTPTGGFMSSSTMSMSSIMITTPSMSSSFVVQPSVGGSGDSGSGSGSGGGDDGGSGTNTGAIAGGVVGGVAVVAALVGIVTWMLLRNKRRKAAAANAAGAGGADAPAGPAGSTYPPVSQYGNSPGPFYGGAAGSQGAHTSGYQPSSMGPSSEATPASNYSSPHNASAYGTTADSTPASQHVAPVEADGSQLPRIHELPSQQQVHEMPAN